MQFVRFKLTFEIWTKSTDGHRKVAVLFFTLWRRLAHCVIPDQVGRTLRALLFSAHGTREGISYKANFQLIMYSA